MTTTLTQHFHFGIPDFTTSPWHADFAALVNAIDTVLYNTVVAPTTDINVRAFGAVGDGVADDTTAFVAALAQAGQVINGASGGRVVVPQGGVYRVGSFTVPDNVMLVGAFRKSDQLTPGGIAAIAGCLRLKAGATITLGVNSGLVGLPIVKDGMAFPQTRAQVNAWTGTAITASGFGYYVAECIIIGFRTAIVGIHGHQYCRDLVIDCYNGIDTSASSDICRFVNIDCEPYAAIGSADTLDNIRGGVAFYLHGGTVGTLLENCFAYGYVTSFRVDDSEAPILVNCHCDNISILVNPESPTGFYVGPSSDHALLLGCRAWAHTLALFVDSGAGRVTKLTDFEARVIKTIGIRVDSGNVDIEGWIDAMPTAISINNSASEWSVDGTRFTNVTSKIIELATNNAHGKFGRNNIIGAGCTATVYPSGAGGTMPTIASAAALVLDNQWDQMFVSGAVTITSVDATKSFPNRCVTLCFTGSPIVTHGANLKLAGSVNWTPPAGSTLTLVFTGDSTWREVSRAAA